jgi:hypothetical protein
VPQKCLGGGIEAERHRRLSDIEEGAKTSVNKQTDSFTMAYAYMTANSAFAQHKSRGLDMRS